MEGALSDMDVSGKELIKRRRNWGCVRREVQVLATPPIASLLLIFARAGLLEWTAPLALTLEVAIPLCICP